MTKQTQTAAPSGLPAERGSIIDERSRDAAVIKALKAGNGAAFEILLDRLSPAMLGLARSILSDWAVAEEVVQETWLAAIRGLERFEGRSSLKTWIFSILTNIARTRAKRERRMVAFAVLSEAECPADELAAAAERSPDRRCAWMSTPRRRTQTPEDLLLSTEVCTVIQKALESMPARQTEVVTLRDIEGWSAQETCDALGLSEANQKVLLHRGRGRVRKALEQYRVTGNKVARVELEEEPHPDTRDGGELGSKPAPSTIAWILPDENIRRA